MQRSLERLRERRREGVEGGFTLIELLIVIVILAILAAIVVFAVSNLTSSSAQASCQSDFQTAQTAAEAFKAQVGNYPNPTAAGYFTGAAEVKTGAGYVTAGPTGAANDPQILDLMNQWTVGGNTVGPWLKTYPYNAGHYQVEIAPGQTSNTATFQALPLGTIGVFNTAASPGVELAATAALQTAGTFSFGTADCGQVA
jgi:prepilin-type N-terminal cleavage/methylation domain-containing protein